MRPLTEAPMVELVNQEKITFWLSTSPVWAFTFSLPKKNWRALTRSCDAGGAASTPYGSNAADTSAANAQTARFMKPHLVQESLQRPPDGQRPPTPRRDGADSRRAARVFPWSERHGRGLLWCAAP